MKRVTTKALYRSLTEKGSNAIKQQNKEAADLFLKHTDLMKDKRWKGLTYDDFMAMLKGAEIEIIKERRGRRKPDTVDLQEFIDFLQQHRAPEKKTEPVSFFEVRNICSKCIHYSN